MPPPSMMITAVRVLCGSLLCLTVACVPAPSSVRAPQSGAPSVGCEKARDADFEGEGEERFWAYLDWLVRSHGAQAGLMPHHVSLAIVRGQAKPGPGGVTTGEISCAGRSYRIALYRDALSGRPLQVAYSTLAHEFFHAVQVRRDGLACEARAGERASYEREASEFAARIVPACRAPTVADPTRSGKLARDRCEVALAEDFAGAGAADLQRYANELTGSLGGDIGLAPGDVAIAITDGRPKPGRRGVIAAEIGCGGAATPYRITLYRHALEGRRLSAAHHAVAREIQHIVQIRRDGLACEGSDADSAERYEREAVAVADRLVPVCK